MITKTLAKQLQRVEEELNILRYRISGTKKRNTYKTSSSEATEAWKKMGGILGTQKRINPVAWQRRIRSEWNHRP